MRNITIALDAMGGDSAPDIVINGAALARKRYPEAIFLIFGDQSKIDPLLDEHPKLQAVSNVVHTEEFVSGRNPCVRYRVHVRVTHVYV